MRPGVKWLTGVWESLASALWPERCVLCRSLLELVSERGVCRGCLSDIPLLVDEPVCDRCGYPLAGAAVVRHAGCRMCPPRASFERARSCCAYGEDVRDLMAAFKFEGAERLCGPFSELLHQAATRCWEDGGVDLVTNVPLHPKRRRERGYDQSEALARRLSKRWGKPFVRTLRRSKATPPLSVTGAAQRASLVRGAFEAVRPRRFAGSAVMLVDDVMTTGATVCECAGVLKRAGAGEVHVLTVARALSDTGVP